MELETGKYVVYRMSEICRIEGFEKKCADGVNEREYLVLSPISSGSARYYVPKETAGERIRALLSREEILDLIHGMVGAEEWRSNPTERKQLQSEALSSGDYGRIASMLRGIYLEKQRREAQGKRLNSTDERTMKQAESMINGEFSFVLGIKPEEVPEFISRKIHETEQK